MGEGLWTIIGVVAGGGFSLLGVFLQKHLHSKSVSKRLISRFYFEIEQNYKTAQDIVQLEKSYGEELKIHPQANPPMRMGPPLRTEAYRDMQISGELMVLDAELRHKISQVYDKIDEYEHGHTGKLSQEVVQDLQCLKQELPRRFKFLQRK